MTEREKKIRELEAELEHSREAAMSELAQIQNEFFREKARAEKAEGIAHEHDKELSRLTLSEEKLKARVVELEALLGRAIGFGLGGSWEHEAAALLAREREE